MHKHESIFHAEKKLVSAYFKENVAPISASL